MEGENDSKKPVPDTNRRANSDGPGVERFGSGRLLQAIHDRGRDQRSRLAVRLASHHHRRIAWLPARSRGRAPASVSTVHARMQCNGRSGPAPTHVTAQWSSSLSMSSISTRDHDRDATRRGPCGRKRSRRAEARGNHHHHHRCCC